MRKASGARRSSSPSSASTSASAESADAGVPGEDGAGRLCLPVVPAKARVVRRATRAIRPRTLQIAAMPRPETSAEAAERPLRSEDVNDAAECRKIRPSLDVSRHEGRTTGPEPAGRQAGLWGVCRTRSPRLKVLRPRSILHHRGGEGQRSQWKSSLAFTCRLDGAEEPSRA
jgi:hypothetical protein